jgi:hypothetical protein
MLGNQVPTGYFAGQEVQGFADYSLCKRGKYCPIGTAKSKVNQLDCLGGYFCPLGTAAKLNEFGAFDTGIKQVNKWIIIEEIEKFINMTEILMKNFSDRGGLAGGWDNKMREYKDSG